MSTAFVLLPGGMNEITNGKVTDSVVLEVIPESVMKVTLDIRCCGNGENLKLLQTRTTGYGWEDNSPNAGDSISFSLSPEARSSEPSFNSSGSGLARLGSTSPAGNFRHAGLPYTGELNEDIPSI